MPHARGGSKSGTCGAWRVCMISSGLTEDVGEGEERSFHSSLSLGLKPILLRTNPSHVLRGPVVSLVYAMKPHAFPTARSMPAQSVPRIQIRALAIQCPIFPSRFTSTRPRCTVTLA